MDHATWIALLAATLLGLRHALDPDHLVAVSGLSAGRGICGPARMARTGFTWGAGHAFSLMIVGTMAIWLNWTMGDAGQRRWEQLVGIVIMVVGLRLVVQWWTARRPSPARVHTGARGFAPAFCIGAVHGIAGTGGVTLALLPLVPRDAQIPALLLFATMTCLSMTLCAALAGRLLSRWLSAEGKGRAGRLALGALSVLFGAGYALAA